MALPTIFVSHSHDDNAWCQPFVTRLRDKGFDVWFDDKNLQPSDDWLEVIQKELVQRAIFIVILTPVAMQSRWVSQEIKLALLEKRTILPILLQDVQLSGFIKLVQILDAQGSDAQHIADSIARQLGYGENKHSSGGLNFDDTLGRRQPIYLLLDVSMAMKGDPITNVNESLRIFYQALMNCPNSIETAWVSLITYTTTDARHYPLTAITAFIPPVLTTRGQANFGAGLHLLNQAMISELLPNSLDRKGDYKPLVLILASDNPGDQWKSEASIFKTRPFPRAASVIGLAFKEYRNIDYLKDITDHIYWLSRNSNLSNSDLSIKDFMESWVRFYFKNGFSSSYWGDRGLEQKRRDEM